ncbi:LytR/AlgR family response regulator transcription factor [Actinomadura soli]|uniref:LytR/AlgR family response regulator transcription factor n=1 Tax=Actinomadura soli TaxID=2508997 RepID=UPI001E33FBD3|nr:LytTR family DNA-binding domain-containing protein [Actinomadura soli]
MVVVKDTGADELIPVGLGRAVHFVRRSEVRYAEAHGDYARLYTGAGSHLVRVSLAALEEAWRDAGFVRIHRSHLVSLAHIDEMVVESGRCTLRVGGTRLTVSRRNTGALRDRLLRGALPGPSRRSQSSQNSRGSQSSRGGRATRAARNPRGSRNSRGS